MATQTPGAPSTSKPGSALSPTRAASLSSAANYRDHGTFPGLVNWLLVLTEPALMGEPGRRDSQGMRPGGIARRLGRPGSQLEPAFHASGGGRRLRRQPGRRPSLTGAGDSLQESHRPPRPEVLGARR